MIQYLHNRSDEWETWLALLVLSVVSTWCMFHWRVELHHIAEAGFAAILAAVPRRAPEMIACLIRRLRSRQPVMPTVIPEKEPEPMSLSTDILAEVEKQIVPLFKAELDKIVAGMGPNEQAAYQDVQAVAAAPTTLGVLKLGADLLAVLHDVTARAEAAETAHAAVVAAQPIGGPNQEQSA